MKAALLSIGDELLIGQVINTNASWLGERLVESGVEVVVVSTIGDARAGIVAEMRRLATLADIVIVSGGLGPTEDDRTRDAICDQLGCGMHIDAKQLARIEQRFADRGLAVNERSRLQARVPRDVQVLPNEYGSAPGLSFSIGESRVFVVPGVPSEMRGIVNDHVLPTLAASRDAIDQITFLIFGPTESELADTLVGFAKLAHDGVTLAYLPALAGIRVRVMRTASGAGVRARYDELVNAIRDHAAQWIVSDDGATMPEATGKALRERKLTLSTAESCTGGLIGKLLTDAGGSSDYYLGGIISYANDVKIQHLDVPAVMIATHGAVSEQVARAMADGARRRMQSDLAVAVTGVAGPGGGSKEKPVGTVWIAVATESSIQASVYRLGNERDVVRQRSAYIALDLVRRAALSWPSSTISSGDSDG